MSIRSNLTPGHTLAEPPAACEGPSGRVVVAAIGALDHRAAVATSVAEAMSASERVAVHVAVDSDEALSVGLEWMSRSPGLPLEIIDDFGGVPATMAIVAEELLAQSDVVELIVVAGQFRRRGASRHHELDGTADAICRAVREVPGAHAVALPVVVSHR